MNPLKPRKPLLPLPLSDVPSSVVFFSLGLSLMFCAPPSNSKVSTIHSRHSEHKKEDVKHCELTSTIVPYLTARRDLVLLRIRRQLAAGVAEAAFRTAANPLVFF